MSQLVPATYLHLFRDFIQAEHGIDLTAHFHAAGYALPEDPAEFVDVQYFSRVCELAVENIDDPVLGLKFGNHLTFTNHGPLGAAMMSCKTIADVMALIVRFESIRFPFHAKLISGPTKTVCQLHNSAHLAPLMVFHSQCILAGTIKFLFESVGSLHKDLSIEFPHPQPDAIAEYQTVLPVTLLFDQPTFAINIPNTYLEYSLSKHDEVSKNIFVNMCDNIQHILQQKQSLSDAVEKLLDAYDRYPSLDQIAHTLSLSGRTLRSHLQQEGTNFRKIVGAHRIQRAKILLLSSKTRIDNIAETLGYSDAANFNRAFKKATHFSPTAYRNHHSTR